MEWTEEMIKQCGRPTGEIGRIVALEMNESHYGLWEWGLSHITIPDNADILDAGCGGGGAIKLLHKLNANCRICGIDISEDMVTLTGEVNADLVKEGTVKLRCSSVSEMPYSDNMFDMVTAFETDYFWDDIPGALGEILRVLTPGGSFVIVDEAYVHELYEERNRAWAELLDIEFLAPEEYRSLLVKAGLTAVEIIEIPERNWITIISRKPEARDT